MKIRVNKMIAALLSLIVLSSAVACNTGTDVPDSTETTAMGDTGGSGTQDESAGNGAYTSSEPLRILFSHTVDTASDKSLQFMQEAVGISLKYDSLPSEQGLNQLNMLMASGDEMDYDYVMIGANTENKAAYLNYAERNLLWDLTDKISSYEHISNLDPRLIDTLKVDDKIYAIASSTLSFTSPNNIVRTDWLAAVDLEAPTDKDSFTEMLQAFKREDPDGLSGNLIPFTAEPSEMISTVSALFGFIYAYEEQGGELIDTRLTDDYKAYLTYMNELFNEGLLDQDYAVNTYQIVTEKIAAGRVGYYAGWTDPAANFGKAMEEAGTAEKNMRAFEPMPGPDGRKRAVANGGNGLSAIGFIPRTTERVDDVLLFIDRYLEPETFVQIIHGEEGVDYEVVDNVKRPILPTFDENRGNMSQLFPVQDGEAYYDLWKLRTRKTESYESVVNTIFETGDPYLEWNILAFAPAFSDITSEAKDVNEHAFQESTKFIVNARPLSEFDAFVEEMNSFGAQVVLETYNEWYKGHQG